MDLDDFLKKAMEEEMRVDEPEKKEEFNVNEGQKIVEPMIDLLSFEKMIKLSRAAINYKKQLMEELADYLNKTDKTDSAKWLALVSSQTLITAKKISTLDAVISTTILGSTAKSDDDYKSVLKSIINVNNLL